MPSDAVEKVEAKAADLLPQWAWTKAVILVALVLHHHWRGWICLGSGVAPAGVASRVLLA